MELKVKVTKEILQRSMMCGVNDCQVNNSYASGKYIWNWVTNSENVTYYDYRINNKHRKF